MKQKIILLVFFLIFFPFSFFCFNVIAINKNTENKSLNCNFENLDIETQSEINKNFEFYAESLNQSFQNSPKLKPDHIAPKINVKNIFFDILSGKFKIDFAIIFNNLFKLFFSNSKEILPTLAFIVLLALLLSIFKNLSLNFLSKNVVTVAFFACYCAIISVITSCFYNLMEYSKNVIDNVNFLTLATIPLIGGTFITKNVLYHSLSPTLVAAITISTNLIKRFFTPLIFMSAAVDIVNNLSDTLHVKTLSKLIKSVIKFGMSTIAVLFVSIVNIQKLSVKNVSQISEKIIKNSLVSIPVVGKLLSESSETIAKCGTILRNTLGASSIVIIGISSIYPIIKILTIIFLFIISSSLIEPIGDKKIVKCITEISKSAMCALSLVLSTCLMFIVLITVAADIQNF